MMVMIEMIRSIQRFDIGLLKMEAFVIGAGKCRLRREVASVRSQLYEDLRFQGSRMLTRLELAERYVDNPLEYH